MRHLPDGKNREKRDKHMKKVNVRKMAAGLAMTCMLALSVPFGVMTSFAANARIAFSDPTVTVGEEVEVTLKVSSTSGDALGRSSMMLAYDPAVLEFVSGTDASGGGAGAVSVKQTAGGDGKTMTSTLTFRALQAGNTQITVTTQEVYDANDQIVTIDKQGSSAVTIQAEDGASADASLSSLKVSPGTLTPQFSADVTEYSVNVGPDVTKLAVSAEAADSSATVNVNGSSDLQMGENTVNCVVTAGDGQTTKTYVIHVTKMEGGAEAGGAVAAGDLTVVLGDVQYQVAKSFDVTTLPEGFEGFTYNYKGQDIMAGKGIQKDLLLICLVSPEGEGKFYIYNEEKDTFSSYMEVSTTSKAIIVLEPDETVTVPYGFTEGIMNLPGGGQVSGWVPEGEESPKYIIFYGMNWNGNKDFYRYDLEENTIQRYFQDVPGQPGISSEQYKDVVVTYKDLLHDYDMRGIVIIFLAIVSAGLVVALVVVIKKKGSHAAAGKQEIREKKSRKKESGELLAAQSQAATREMPVEEEPEEEEEDDFEFVELDEEEDQAEALQEKQETKPDNGDSDDDFEFIDL